MIRFVGDISLNDSYSVLYKNNINPFTDLEKILFDSDLVIGNLECLAEGSEGENLLKAPRLKTDVETLNMLKYMNLGLALLAHNHVYDNLKDGFIKTINKLEELNIKYIGAGLSVEQAKKPFIANFHGSSITIFNYVTHDTNPSMPKNADVFLNYFNMEQVKSDIQCYRNMTDIIILCLHWGGECEGGAFPDWDQPKIARKLIDLGADLIIGNHSHTIQPKEIYREKCIYYSLGNFCFSPLLNSKIKKMRASRSKGLVINVKFNLKEINVFPLMVKNENCIIKLKNKFRMRFELFTKIIFSKIVMTNKIIWTIYKFIDDNVKPVFVYLYIQRGSIKGILLYIIRKANRKGHIND